MSKPAPRRRRVDASDPLERLTSEQRADIYLRGLKADIAEGCRRFWKRRDMPEPKWSFQPPPTQSKP